MTADARRRLKRTADNANMEIETMEARWATILSELSKRMTTSFLLHFSGTRCISAHIEPVWKGKSNPY